MGRDNEKKVSIEVFKSNSSEISEKDKVFYDILDDICERTTNNLRMKSHSSVLVVIADSMPPEGIKKIESAWQEKTPVLIIHKKGESIPKFSEDDNDRILSLPYENKQDVLEFLEEAILSLLFPTGRRRVVSSEIVEECDI